MGYGGKKMSASDRRILLTLWAGHAFEVLISSDYDNLRKRCFEKTGCLLTADGTNDDLVQPEGLTDYKVFPPMPGPGPEDNPEIESPEPAQDPLDIIPENDMFTPQSDDENIDLKSEANEEVERLDMTCDRIFSGELIGKKIRGHYNTGWHIGTLHYFNTKLKEYMVKFEDGSEDYIEESDIDGLEIILLVEEETTSRVGRVRKNVDYKRITRCNVQRLLM